jgi:hypothetical protein
LQLFWQSLTKVDGGVDNAANNTPGGAIHPKSAVAVGTNCEKFFLNLLVHPNYSKGPNTLTFFENMGWLPKKKGISLISGFCLFYTLLLVPFSLAFFWTIPLCDGSFKALISVI